MVVVVAQIISLTIQNSVITITQCLDLCIQCDNTLVKCTQSLIRNNVAPILDGNNSDHAGANLPHMLNSRAIWVHCHINECQLDLDIARLIGQVGVDRQLILQLVLIKLF